MHICITCSSINITLKFKVTGTLNLESPMVFPDDSDGKEFNCQCRRCGFDPWVGKILWRRKRQPSPVLLPGKSHGYRSLAGYSLWGHWRVERVFNMANYFSRHFLQVIQILLSFFRKIPTSHWGIPTLNLVSHPHSGTRKRNVSSTFLWKVSWTNQKGEFQNNACSCCRELCKQS